MKKSKTILSIVLSLAVAMAMLPGTAMAAGDGSKSVEVKFAAGTPTKIHMVQTEITATSDLVEKYFPEFKDEEPSGVSFADVIIAAHIKKYGEKNLKEHVDITKYEGMTGLSMSKQFDNTVVGLYYVNDKGVNSVCDEVKAGDKLFAMSYDDFNYAGLYGSLEKAAYKVKAGKKVSMKVVADNFGTQIVPTDAVINEVNPKTGKMTAMKTTYSKGKAAAKFSKVGVHHIAVSGTVKYKDWGGNDVESGFAGAIAKVTVGLDKAKITKKTAGKKKATLKWKKVVGAKSYQVYRATKKNGKFKKVATVKKLSYTNKKLKSKKNYYYKVRAYAKADGKAYTGAFSQVVKVKVK
ncbi:MAG: hypothetical protein IJ132_00930 [Firmicutes bacterium]|nr:hypothetical protein [Bacillota bacterium]